MTAVETDDDLMRRVVAGDSTAIGDLYDRYGTSAYSLALRMVGDHGVAEEIVQETFVRAWRQAAAFDRDRGPVAVWMLRIARNLAIDELRRRAARPQAVEADDYLERVEAQGSDPADLALRTMRHETVSAALDRLPEEQRQALQLAYYGGLSQSEIAARLGDPLGTVKTRMRLGLQKLKRDLAIDEGEAER